MSTGWTPPAAPPGGPPRYQAPPGGSGAKLTVGIVAILLGIGAVVFADQLKLDAERLLLGDGVYIKDGYRAFLTFAGIALAVLGVVLTLLAALNASTSSTTGILVATLVLSGLVLAAGSIVVAALAANRQEQAAPASSPEQRETADPVYDDPVPQREATGDETISCGVTGNCYAGNNVPVYPVAEGDPCVTPGGDQGSWISQDELSQTFECYGPYE